VDAEGPGGDNHLGLHELQAGESTSLVLKKGNTTEKFSFPLGSTQIPSITEKPVKSLGKVFDCSLSDTASIRATNEELEAWLGTVDYQARTIREVQGLDIPTRHPP